MSPSSRSRHTPSARDLFRSSNVTSVGPVIIWQTKYQRRQHDLAGLAGTGGERSKETQETRRNGDERRVDRSRPEYLTPRERVGESPRRWRKESPPGRRRGQSCSRIRSYSRGRSRSPRRAGEPGPGILKGRSATHDGRKREGSVGWKMFRINRVEEVREFSPWPEERLSQGHGGEDDREERRGNEVGEDVVSSQIVRSQVAQSDFCGKIVEAENFERSFEETDCSVQVTITPTRRITKIVKQKKRDEPSVSVGRGTFEKVAQVGGGDLAKGSACEEIGAVTIEQDGNNNDVVIADIFEDDTEEQFFHGFDPLLDRDPLLPVAAGYDTLIDELESEDTSPLAGLLEVEFLGGYQSCPVECVYKDCQATSLPSTLGLLPLPQAGHQWLCAVHSHCLLCPVPTFPSTTVRCAMCARLYHTDHLQMEGLYEDKLERELFICKLCSDPDQFTQHGGEQGDNSPLQTEYSASSSLSLPSPATTYTKIKPRTNSSVKVSKPSTVSYSRGRALQHDDPSLPPGWYRQLVKNSDSRWRVVIIGPDGRRFWSRSDLKKAFRDQGKTGIKWEEFNFSLFGSQG